MADFHELEKRYEKIPQEMKSQRHWICFKTMSRNGKTIKAPISPVSAEGTLQGASSSDKASWADFGEALRFCAENDLDGLGFELGESGMFGVDIFNHADENGKTMPQADFQAMANEFVKKLDSYSEWSVSGNGIHVLCYGRLPEGTRKTNNIEIYDGNRFFAMTGKNIGTRSVKNATEAMQELWRKYMAQKPSKRQEEDETDEEVKLVVLSDDEVLRKVYESPEGEVAKRLMEGDILGFEDEYEARKALCSYLAQYGMCGEEQIDRIFRTSALFDFDWDDEKSNRTVGYFVIQEAIESCAIMQLSKSADRLPKYVPPKAINEMNFDEEGNPIFRVSENYNKIGKRYPLDDTGNAMRFYDCFGENFHYDVKNRMFMVWTGKTWVFDSREVIRKYANKLIDLLREEAAQMRQNYEDESDEGRKKTLGGILKDFVANIKHLSSKNGKDAMLTELRSMGTIPVEPTDFDKDPYKINTESGIVDLISGEVLPFDREAMFASNTGVEVSFEEPVSWIKFLNEIFERDNPEETKEIIECYQRCVGYTLTGITTEQVMFILNGDGSNGKGTQSRVLRDILGDYHGIIDPKLLMVQKNPNNSSQYSLAQQVNTRFLLTSEADKGSRLAESDIKRITGSDEIEAQKKFGQPFKFEPKFKLWMETNYLPYIGGKDYGVWRRVFLFTFKRVFKDEEKDKDLPEKLKVEYPQILGWAIQGAVKYLSDKDLKQPECLKYETTLYRESFDGISKFIKSECRLVENAIIARSKMYRAYKQWASDNKEHAYPESKFREEMVSKGFKLCTNEKTGIQYYEGITVNDDIGSYVEDKHFRGYDGFGED